MRFMYTLARWGSVACALFFVACSATPSPDRPGSGVSSAAEVSRARGQEFSQAVVRASASGWAAKEVESLVDFYTDDAILFPPKGEPIRGRDAIRSYWSRTPDRRILEHSIQVERADLSGDLLAEHGRFSLTSRAGENEPERSSANFISVWRRGADGLWRKHLDSWW